MHTQLQLEAILEGSFVFARPVVDESSERPSLHSSPSPWELAESFDFGGGHLGLQSTRAAISGVQEPGL